MRSSTGEITHQLDAKAQESLIILPPSSNKLSDRVPDSQTPSSDYTPSPSTVWHGSNVTAQLAPSPDDILFVHKPRKASSRSTYTTNRSAIFIEQLPPVGDMSLEQPLLASHPRRRSWWWCCLNFCSPKKNTETSRNPEQLNHYIPPRSSL